jgi:DNA invertase Pin-like site-specific DNA recombinase
MLGYARLSTNERDTAAQVSALKSAGCEKIFREKASRGRWDRPELRRLLDQLRTIANVTPGKGNVVVQVCFVNGVIN